ncbi:MAG: DUF4231 domain-containing protein [Actinomycetota bacterium]|nr:DUF4231 domain-containing protein [Actinomycetota bacterium]
MRSKATYRDSLKRDLEATIVSLDLPPREKTFLHLRWLDQVLWMERAADSARNRYYALRLTTIIGGVIVPALVSYNVNNVNVGHHVPWPTVVLSLVVAVSAAVEEFFHYGERWRHYRRTVERLKEEGWQFFQLTGNYRRFHGSYADAYPQFAQRIETLLQSDVNAYMKQVAQDKKEGEEGRTEEP